MFSGYFKYSKFEENKRKIIVKISAWVLVFQYVPMSGTDRPRIRVRHGLDAVSNTTSHVGPNKKEKIGKIPCIGCVSAYQVKIGVKNGFVPITRFFKQNSILIPNFFLNLLSFSTPSSASHLQPPRLRAFTSWRSSNVINGNPGSSTKLRRLRAITDVICTLMRTRRGQ